MKIVELKSVEKIYPMGKTKVHALRGLDLTVHQGELLIIKGASGSGKSTTLNIIGGMDIATSGTVKLVGKDVSTLSDRELSMLRRKHIGFIFQSFNLVPVLNARENVAYPLHLQGVARRKEKAEEALCQVGLKDFMKHRPNELSGGQIQRVAIARALVNKPDLILADEPTANLDSKNSEQILELIINLQQNHKLTFIVSTHHQFLIENADRVVECRDGKIVSPEVMRVPA